MNILETSNYESAHSFACFIRFIQISNDSDGDVRSAAFQVIAAIWRCIGEAAAKRLFAEVANDKLKMDKVKI